MRKSVTLPAVIFELIDKLEDKLRLIAYDIIFRAMFNDKEIDYSSSEIPDAVKNVLIVAKYELRKIKTKYENGCAIKTYNEAETFACKNERSKENQNKAKESARARDIYNTNNNLNTNKEDLEDIIRNVIHELSINNNSNLSDCLLNETEMNLQSICEQIDEYDKQLDFVNADTCLRFKNMMKNLAKSKKPIGIGEEVLMPADILSKIAGNLPRKINLINFMEKLKNMFKSADDSPTIRNKYRYLIASIYNEVKGI